MGRQNNEPVDAPSTSAGRRGLAGVAPIAMNGKGAKTFA